MDFEAMGLLAVEDADARVRVFGLTILGDYQDKARVPLLLKMMRSDEAVEVRAAAARGLGAYVYLGEIEELPPRTLRQIEEQLLSLQDGKDPVEVQRAALEALGFSSREEVTPLIERAIDSPDRAWKASALTAMGHSASSQWRAEVLSMLDSSHPQLRAEAARAAGELEIKDASRPLLEMLDDSDPAARRAAIWSLSQIGGSGISEALQRLLDEADDDEETAFLQSAVDNLEFTEEVQMMMPILDVAEGEGEADDEADAWVEEVDLDEYDLFDEDEEDAEGADEDADDEFADDLDIEDDDEDRV
jgi:HEAT repeat protein